MWIPKQRVAQHWHNAASSWMGPTRRILALARLTTVVARLSTANVLFFFTFHFCYFCCCRFCKCCLCCCFCLIKRILTLDHLTAVLARFSFIFFTTVSDDILIIVFVGLVVIITVIATLVLSLCQTKGFLPSFFPPLIWSGFIVVIAANDVAIILLLLLWLSL